jgi:hypothetical protein
MRRQAALSPQFSSAARTRQNLLEVKKGKAANKMEALIVLSSFALVLMVTAFWG